VSNWFQTTKEEEKMRTHKKLIALVLCAAFIGFVPSTRMVWAMEKKASMHGEMQKEITGTVEKSDAGLIIKADEGNYLVAGQDLSAMVGKRVKATGMVAEAEDHKTLTVTSCSETK
jgi:hypothetical protein